ncbi:MAG: methylmalonyl-CoA decarboxylase [Rhodocyclaceae bacterium]|nr:methylmalonyl-CoA decarboxylase [Rhodocyclaceae bacterium]
MYVIAEKLHQIGSITLTHHEKRNALSRVLIGELMAAMERLRAEKVRALILTAGMETRVWSAGHDINELPEGEDPLAYSDPLEQLLRAVRHFPAPVIAMVHGSVWGGATDLVLSCDLVIGDDTCSFAITPVNLGLPYNTVGTLNFMRRLPLNVAKEMMFTARPITAEEAQRWSLLNHLVPEAELHAFTLNLARGIATKAPLAVEALKEQLRMLGDSAPLQPGIFERIQELRNNVYTSRDYREGIRAFKEKRKPEFRGE